MRESYLKGISRTDISYDQLSSFDKTAVSKE